MGGVSTGQPPHFRDLGGGRALRAVCSCPCVPRECSWCAAARSTSCALPALPVVPPSDTRRSPAPGCHARRGGPSPGFPRVGVTATRPVRKDPRAHTSARHPSRQPTTLRDRPTRARNPATAAAATPDRRVVRGPTLPRGQGQWALGHREPLNANERIKKDDDGLHVPAADRDHLPLHRLRRHRPQRPARPDPLVGPVHAAAPGIDGGRTAILEPEELEDKYFMLRVRIDGGQLTTEAPADHR